MDNTSELRQRIHQLEQRVDFLEEQKRFTLDLLEAASTLGDFQVSISSLQDPGHILREMAERVKKILPLRTQAVFLVTEEDADVRLAFCSPEQDTARIESNIAVIIDKGIFSWALKERRAVFISGKEPGSRFVLHVIATNSRVRGMFVGEVEGREAAIYDYSLSLLSIVLLHTANAIESFELYKWIQRINRDLETKVKALAVSEQELKKHQQNLQDLVEERTRDLNNAMSGLREALDEKEVLIKEIHHRVKNNLQIVSSLLALQGRNMDDGHCREMLRESQTRVRSMALIHENLYRSDDITSIDFGIYMQSLVRELSGTLGATMAGVRVRLEPMKHKLDIERAISCGLIVNELLTNALKHAFRPSAKQGEVLISFSREDESYVLRVADNGTGLPEDFDPRRNDSLGFLLISTLADQLGGEYRVKRLRPGTEVSVIFSADDPVRRPPLES